MLKYALINNNKVENIIVCESSEFVEMIKPHYQHVEFVGNASNNKDIQIGYLYENGKIFEDPESIKQREKLLEETTNTINTLKSKETLTDDEKEHLKLLLDSV